MMACDTSCTSDRVFTGSEEELEIGFGDGGDDKDDADSDSASSESASEETSGEDADQGDDANENSSGKPGRYLFVRVVFDESLLTGPKSAPIEPEKPERLRELEAEEKENEAEGEKEDVEAPESGYRR